MPTEFRTSDPEFASRVRASFARQAAMDTIGASILRVVPGEVEVQMASAAHLTQQHGFVHGGIVGAVLAGVAVGLAIPLALTYAQTGLVPRFPTAIAATGLVILAALSFTAGLILDTVVRGRREVRRLAYLADPAPGQQDRR